MNKIKILETRQELLDWRAEQDQSIGFVPTMGNLHQGHLSLIEKSLQQNTSTVLSIFVNPTQFGPDEDFHRYPRTLAEDLNKVQQLIVKQQTPNPLVVFAPSSNEQVYAHNFTCKINVGSLAQELEEDYRPGHLTGVSTVIFLLFSSIRPHRAYFGKKDYQQLLVVEKLVHDLRLNVQIVGLPIVRDDDGLAMSSRNQYLSKEHRAQALKLPKTLKKLKKIFLELGLQACLDDIQKEIQLDPKWQYLTLRNKKTLEKYTQAHTPQQAIILAVYNLEGTRLLDNLEIKENS